ncbi:MAG: 50S ribosomal protein L23 [bacterium]|nr:50S ribosomal protein L23 [bacterium]
MAILDIFRKKKKKKKPRVADSASRAVAKGKEEDLSSSPSRAKGTLTRKAAMADEKEKPKRRRVEEKKIEEKKEVEKESPKLKSEVRFGQSYKILKGPHITEKAGDLAEKNQYVFKIFPRANKIGVKKAIEDTYGVDVVSIKIINVPKKKRRLGKIQGTRPGYKKAIVKIKKGQKIEVLPR